MLLELVLVLLHCVLPLVFRPLLSLLFVLHVVVIVVVLILRGRVIMAISHFVHARLPTGAVVVNARLPPQGHGESRVHCAEAEAWFLSHRIRPMWHRI